MRYDTILRKLEEKKRNRTEKNGEEGKIKLTPGYHLQPREADFDNLWLHLVLCL